MSSSAALLMALLSASALHAQERSARASFVIGAGAGPASASISVGGQRGSEAGLAYTGRVGLHVGRNSVLGIEVDVQPFEVSNPARAEAFQASYILVSLLFYPATGGGAYIRPSLGVQSRQWSGDDPVTDSDKGPALGVAGGYELGRARRVSLAAELFWRTALIEVEGSVTARLVGIRLVALVRS